MTVERPDLSNVDPEIRAYVEALEEEVARLRSRGRRATREPEIETEEEILEPSEPPTTMNVVTVSRHGLIKRTPRHLYSRQNRGGMGVFDLDAPEEDPPALLVVADESRTLVLFSNQGRTYRMPLTAIGASPVRARGIPLSEKLSLRPEERIVAILPYYESDAPRSPTGAALVSERGWVSFVRYSFLGKNMIQGVSYHDAEKRGELVDACWLSADDDLFLATRTGMAIRIPLTVISQGGGLGIRPSRDDAVVAITAVDDDGEVFLLSADGKGTIRSMEGFRANKTAGGQGKIAMKTDALADATAVEEEEDLFVISRNGKIIRFEVEQVPPKENPVQGVNCIALRGDEAVAVATSEQ